MSKHPDRQPATGAANLPFLEALYVAYRRDPASVDPDWRAHFAALDAEYGLQPFSLGPRFARRVLFAASEGPAALGAEAAAAIALQSRVEQLIRAYRVRGHLIGRFDPLGLPRPAHPELEPAYYGLGEEHLDLRFAAGSLGGEAGGQLRLGEILDRLRETYCRSLGVQYMHIDDVVSKEWLRERLETSRSRVSLTPLEQMRILIKLTDAVLFEEFVQKKYLGAKRFSLEGGESLIPLLDLAITQAGEQGVEQIVIGMAHRGRLNVLANIIGMSMRQIFRLFEDLDPEAHLGRDDVKYHVGHTGRWITSSGRQVRISLCFNPSHLEFVDPIALGRLRARQDRYGDTQRRRGLGILIHGDAAFAGQGIVQETLNLSELAGYRTGGTLHVIVNNQIGFSTEPREARSNTYASSVAKLLQVPIFMVNGEDPEAVAQAVRLALDFRREFQRDAVIDMYCYRKYGHNEGDEPAFTQPLMVRAIAGRPSVREGYLEHLLRLGGTNRAMADGIAAARRRLLEREHGEARSPALKPQARPRGAAWERYLGGADEDAPEVPTGLPAQQLGELLRAQTRLPEGFHAHPKVLRLLEQRAAMAAGERPLDWAAAESLALASLAVAGHPVRLSGQDSVRGTFSQRHAGLVDQVTGVPYYPLQNLARDQAPVELLNSPLSEAGVLGFEYGYALDYPAALVLWEAQFGDFANGAQVIIDQFVSSAEDKWGRLNGLTLLLPHGFEGQGPEHSSGRLERFLSLCAEDNLQVVQPSTPAQYFHVLRRQVLRPWRKPLVVMTPKSLLRLPACSSPLAELTRGGFKRVIPDVLPAERPVRRVLLCAGKVYYDLAAARAERGHDDVAILRLEQLYPLRDEALQRALLPYPLRTPVYWVQEEPENMGAWQHLLARFGTTLWGAHPFEGISREASASPATGFASSHRLEQERLLEAAFARN
ncbi:2-oxoglutarate dehydrogenase E1 component [bacterium]|nr:2-oxoglutarate dehydrogenase E1 component [bacterium]